MKQNNQIRNSRSRKIGVGVGFALATIAVGSAIAVPNIIAYQNRPQSTNNTSWEEGKYGEGGGYYTAPVEVTDPSTQVFKATVTATDHEVNKIALYNLTGETLTLPIAPSVKSIKVAGNELTVDDYYIENNIIILTKTVSGSDKIEVELTINEPIIDGSYVVTRMWNENTEEFDEQEVNMEYKPSADVPGFYSDTTKSVPLKSGNIIKFKCTVTDPNQICRFELNDSTKTLSFDEYTVVSIWNGKTCEYLNDNGESGVTVASQWEPRALSENEQGWQRNSGATGEFTFTVVGNSKDPKKCFAVATNYDIETDVRLNWDPSYSYYHMDNVPLTPNKTYIFSVEANSNLPGSFYIKDSSSGDKIDLNTIHVVVKRNGLPLEGENNNWDYKDKTLTRITSASKLQEKDIVQVYFAVSSDVSGSGYMECAEKTTPMVWVNYSTHKWGGYWNSKDLVTITNSKSATFELDLSKQITTKEKINTFCITQKSGDVISPAQYTITSITKGGVEEKESMWKQSGNVWERNDLTDGGVYKFTVFANNGITLTDVIAKMSNETDPSKDVVCTWKDDTTYSAGGYYKSETTAAISTTEPKTFSLTLTDEEYANQIDTFTVYDSKGDLVKPNQYDLVSVTLDGNDDSDQWIARQLCWKRKTLPTKGVFKFTIQSTESDLTVNAIISNEYKFNTLTMKWYDAADPKGWYTEQTCSICVGDPKGFECNSTTEHPINTFAPRVNAYPMNVCYYSLESVTLNGEDDTDNWHVDTTNNFYVRYGEEKAGTYIFKISYDISGGFRSATGVGGSAWHQEIAEADMKWDDSKECYISSSKTYKGQPLSFTCDIDNTHGINCFGVYYASGSLKDEPCPCGSVTCAVKGGSEKFSFDLLHYTYGEHFTTEDREDVKNKSVTFGLSLNDVLENTPVYVKGWHFDYKNHNYGAMDWDTSNSYFKYNAPKTFGKTGVEYTVTFVMTDTIRTQLNGNLKLAVYNSSSELCQNFIDIGSIKINNGESGSGDDWGYWTHSQDHTSWIRGSEATDIPLGTWQITLKVKMDTSEDLNIRIGNLDL